MIITDSTEISPNKYQKYTDELLKHCSQNKPEISERKVKHLLKPIHLSFKEQSNRIISQTDTICKQQKQLLPNSKNETIKDRYQQSPMQASSNISQQSSNTQRAIMKKLVKSFQIPVIFDLLISTPRQKLQSLKSHLKSVRRQNQNYLKTKNTSIKQIIKRKVSKVSTQPSCSQHSSNKYEKTISKSNEKSYRQRIEKYDDKLEQNLIRQNIHIQQCYPLFSYSKSDDDSGTNNFNNDINKKLSLQINKIQEDIGSQNKWKTPASIFMGNKKYLNLLRLSLEKQDSKQRNDKMMLISRLHLKKNVVQIITSPKKDSNVKYQKSKSIEINYQPIGPIVIKPSILDKICNKASRSYDISINKKNYRKTQKSSASYNFIKGSLFSRFMKRKQQLLSQESIQKQLVNHQIKEIKTDEDHSLNDKILDNQASLYLTQNVDKSKEDDIPVKNQKKKKIVISDKCIDIVKRNPSIEKSPSRIEQQKLYQSVKPKLYYEDQQSK